MKQEESISRFDPVAADDDAVTINKSVKASTVYSEPAKFANPFSHKLFEKFRYSLLDFEKLMLIVKLCANRNNLVNITKSGIKQVQIWSFHLISQILRDLVYHSRESRSQHQLVRGHF